MLLQLKLFVAKDCKILDTQSHTKCSDYFLYDQIPISPTLKMGSPKYKKYYINNIFLIQGSIYSFVWIYNHIKCGEHRKGSHCTLSCILP